MNIKKTDGSHDLHGTEESYSLTMSVKWHKVECFASAIRYFVSALLAFGSCAKAKTTRQDSAAIERFSMQRMKTFFRGLLQVLAMSSFWNKTHKRVYIRVCLSVNETRLFRIIMFLLFVCFLHFWVYTDNENTQVAQTFTALLKEQWKQLSIQKPEK